MAVFVFLCTPSDSLRCNADGSGCGGLITYFGVFYFLYYSVGTSVTLIPYDALGMEITEDYNDRSTLFGIKGLMQNTGYLLQGILVLAMALAFPTDTRIQVLYPTVGWAVVCSASFFIALRFVRERPIPDTHLEKPTRPFVPSIRSLFRNGPYRCVLDCSVALNYHLTLHCFCLPEM